MNHKMDNYLFDRIMIDARHVISLANQQGNLEHQGLKGRFRELLIDGIMGPWLPNTVRCATGTVISSKNAYRNKTQEDILLIDQSISPSILLKRHVEEGVYLRNSVLARIEVKSNLNINGIKDFKTACNEYHQLNLDLYDERIKADKIRMQEINMLFAYKSELKKETVFSWFKDINDGSISSVCVLNKGFWKINSEYSWDEYECVSNDSESEYLAAFIGIVSNTAFRQHIEAQGRDWLASLESGIGNYFNNWRKTST